MNGTPEAFAAYAGSIEAVTGVVSVIVSLLCGGFAATHLRSRIPAWALGIVALVATLHFVDHQPAGARMVAIVISLLLAIKTIVAGNETTRLTFRQWIAFTLWPGM